MELQFQKNTVRYLGRTIHETRAQEETAEVIIPDSYPDAGRIVYCTASAVLRSKECRTGGAVISGGIRASAIYVPEDQSAPRTLEAYLPFSIRVENPAINEQTQLFVVTGVRQAEARLVNSRKILFRIHVGCTADGYDAQEEPTYTLIDPPPQLQLRRQTYPVLLTAETAEKNITVSEDLELPAGKADMVQLCGYETRPELTDCRVVGSKAVFKGNLFLQLLYLADDGSVHTYEQQLPFSQFCELVGDYEDAPLTVQLCVTDAEAEIVGQGGRNLLLSVNMTAQCAVGSTHALELVEDAYAVGGTLQPQWQQYALQCSLDRQLLRESVRKQMAENATAIVACCAYADFPYTEREADTIKIKTPLNVKLLYLDGSGQLQGCTAKAESVCETALCDDGSCVATACVCACYGQLTGERAEVRCDVCVQSECFARPQLRTLCGGSVTLDTQQATDRPSVIICAADQTQPLWELAKRYGAKAEDIAAANHLEGTHVESGKLLLIPM